MYYFFQPLSKKLAEARKLGIKRIIISRNPNTKATSKVFKKKIKVKIMPSAKENEKTLPGNEEQKETEDGNKTLKPDADKPTLVTDTLKAMISPKKNTNEGEDNKGPWLEEGVIEGHVLGTIRQQMHNVQEGSLQKGNILC
jgi:hypothetical protein